MKTLFSKIIRLSLVSLWLLSSPGITGAPPASASSETHETATGPRLWLRSGDFDPLAEEPNIPGTLHRTLALGQPGLYLVQFSGPIQDTWSAALKDAGLEVVTYLPDYAYLVWGDTAAVEKLRAATPLRWAGVYEPFYALHPALTTLDDTTEVDVLVQVYAHPGAEQTVQQILDTAMEVIRPPQKVLVYQNLGVRIAADRLAWLAGQPDVVNIEPRPVYQLLDEVQGQLMAGSLNASGTQPSGPGYLAWLQGLDFSTNPADYPIVDVTDDGIDDGSATPLHPDFYVSGSMANADRLSYNVNWTSDPAADGQDGHGNINASIVAGYNDQTGTAYEDANGYNYGLGLNPFGRVAGSKIFNNAGYWDLPGDNYTSLISQTYALGGRISTNSWGAETNGDYTADDQAYDALVRDAQPGTGGNQEISIFFAAGNAGSSSNTTGSPGNAKNVVTVGATENYRPTWTDGCGVTSSGADSAQDIASFSSRGPTDDTRVKPDLVAPGTHIQGAASQDPGYDGNSVCDQYHPTGQTLYAASSGTSHSTPAAAGAASLVYRYYEENFGGQTPSPALLKAYMINATSYLTGAGAGGDLPSNDQGYGAINLGTAFDGVPCVVVDQSETFGASSEDYELESMVANSAQPFRVTLAWTDAPGPTIGNAYVNNLDLEVTIGGQTYKGNVFSGAASTTGGTADPRNNVESVFLPAGQSGAFTVYVTATNIAGDGVPGNADTTDQDFALIIYNGKQESGTLDGIVYDGTLGGVIKDATMQAITGTVALTATTDAAGAYTLTVAPDTYTVSAWKYGYTLESATGVSVTKDLTTTTDFTLTQTALYTLTGCITDTVTGDPLAATVAVVGPFGAPVTQTTAPQANGCYTLTLHGGSYTVTVEARLHQSGAAGVNLTADTVQDFALTAATNDGILWGKVTSLETSNPVAGAAIQVTPGLTETQSAGDGSYELQLPHGTYTVTVSAPLYETQVETNVTVPQSNLTEHNYALGTSHMLLLPPEGLGATLDLGSQVTRTLTISNTGSGGLEFEIAEHTPGFTPASSMTKVTGGTSPLVGGIRGGSDPYGYTYADSSEPDGPLFEWLDATDGTALGLGDDGESNVTLPFAFNFYGDSSTDLRVGNNGGAIFGATSGGLSPIHSALGGGSCRDDIIVPFWDDMDDETGDVYYKTVGLAPNRRFVVEWHDRPHHKVYGGVGTATFELILYEGTNNIKFQYQDVVFGDTTYPYWDYGGWATVGIRQTGSNYLQYSYNQPILSDGLSICFQYPGSPPCDPQDIPWLSTDPISGTVAAGNTLAVEVGFDAAVSEVDQPGNYTAMLQIASNDPEAQPAVNYPVTMTVQPPATWGKLQGTIMSDRPGGSLENALVEVISGAATVYSTTTASDGAYSRWLPGGPYTVTVAASGYVSDQQSVTVSAGVTTTHDVELRLLAPEIAVMPAVLTTTQDMNSLVTRTLTISNLGETNLDFSIVELQGQVMASLSLPTPRAPLHTGPVEVSPAVSAALAQTGKVDFWVQMVEQADLSPAYTLDWRERGRFVYDTLREVAERSQAGVRVALAQAGVEYTPHWIINAIYIEGGDSVTVHTLQQMDGVARILEHRVLPLPQPQKPPLFEAFSFEPLSPEWGLNIIQAPETWANYTSGEGIVVANIDTGVRYTHEVLNAHYRGNLGGGNFDHDFNWYDPQGATAPVDDHGHGSHTMGTMIGDDGNSNQTGVAPGATWIAADGCDSIDCPDADLISSGEWLLAPCPIGVTPGDAQCDPDKRPHVVNNSWGDCYTTTTSLFEAQIDAWRAAGIFTAFANGNTGNCGYGSAFCNSMGNPARHYQVTSVGATNSSDNIASFSLWGPTDDSDPRLSEYANIKPEVSAPGASVRSSTNGSDSSYGTWSGTSMATPHVAGVAALILSANPGLIGQNDLIEDILKDTADLKVYNTGCGNEGSGNVPNNAFGWGRINALHAVERALTLMNLPWMRTAPTSGTISSGHATDVIVTFDATGLEPGIYTGTLRIQHNDPYASSVNVPLTMTVLMPPPDFTLSKIASDDQVEIGLPFTYTLTVDNAGGDATGIVISDTLPAHTQFAWAGAGGALQGGTVVWDGLSLSGWSTFSVSYGVTVTCVASGTQIVNDDYRVTATEWPTPTVGAPVIVTATADDVTADFTFLVLVLTEWPVAFTNLSTNATGYTWAFGDGATSSDVHPQHAYGATGARTVILTATNLCHSAVASQPLTVETYAVTLHPATDARHANPDEVVTYTLQVTNTGTLSDTFNLNLSGNVWPTHLSTDALALDVGETATVTVSVAVPYGTESGAQDEVLVTVRASSDPRTSPATAEVTFTTTANTFYGVTLDAAALTQAADVGETVTYTLEVVNTSNALDTIVFSRVAPGWPTTFSTESLEIDAGGTRHIQVYITVPLTATSEMSDTAVIRAVGSGDPAEVTLTTRVAAFKCYLPLVMRD